MLSESFVTSFQTSKPQQRSTPQAGAILKDAGICIHEFQPSSAVSSSFKNSSTDSNCLAVSSSHIFAAQSGKAVVHVYSRERGNQEATVPFPERIRCLAIAGGEDGNAAVLVLGTEEGKLILWETCTGRQVSTSASHLQAITSLVVDPTNNFILSGSDDANVHVWSLSRLLSFSKPSSATQNLSPSDSPVRTFSNHSAPITAVAVGHGSSRSNIAISCSRDSTAAVWEYHTGKLLHTYLLPSPGVSLEIDPADRAAYVGYEDGSVQGIDFFKVPSVQNVLYDASQQSTPTQLSAQDRWCPPPSSSLGPAQCLTLSYDGMILLSGHANGVVSRWDIAKRRFVSQVTMFSWPVTNLQMLSPSGLSGQRQRGNLAIHNIVKPRLDHALSNASTTGLVPASYILQAQISTSKDLHRSSEEHPAPSAMEKFSQALTHPSFPSSILTQGLQELTNPQPATSTSTQPLSSSTDPAHLETLTQETTSLHDKLRVHESTRQANMAEIIDLRSQVASLEATTADLLDQKQQWQRESELARIKREEIDVKARRAYHEAEAKGMNGDRAMRKVEAEMEGGSEMSED